MKKNTTTAASSKYLPEDLTIDIQRRLSLPCLRRLCCVSRSWNFLLSNSKFFYESLFNGENEDANTRLLIAISDDPINSIGPKYVYSCLHYDSLLPIDNPDQDDDDEGANFQKFPGKQPVMVGCEGGLILLEYRRDQFGQYFGLLNPATGEAKMLPPLPQDLLSYNYDCFVGQSITSALTLVEKEDDQYYHCKVVSVHHYFTNTNYATRNFLYNKAYVFSSDELLGLSKYGKMICTNGMENLQVVDVTSGQLHALPFKEKNLRFEIRLVTYVPSKILLPSTLVVNP